MIDEINIHSDIINHPEKDLNLTIDKVYTADPKVKNIKNEVLSKLIGVGNSGGFRIIGPQKQPILIVLYTTGEDIYWKDELNEETGVFVYYGDNKKPGNNLHETKLGGNVVLKNIFMYAQSENISERQKIPPIFVFKKRYVYSGRDVQFLGLAVPGANNIKKNEWLSSIWVNNTDGGRFQNYKAIFSILDTSEGSSAKKSESSISIQWIRDIRKNKTLTSKYAPIDWIKYIENSKFNNLKAAKQKVYKDKHTQLPTEKIRFQMLEHLIDFFNKSDTGILSYDFELFAVEALKKMNKNILSIKSTRRYKDGGFDAVGEYSIFESIDNSITVEFYVEAKCYSVKNSVGIKETSRLISRIKSRQFGVMFTTSYISKQAFDEIIEDNHPIVIISGIDIIEYLQNFHDIKTGSQLITYLNSLFRVKI